MGLFGGNDDIRRQAEEAALAENQRQNRIIQGTQYIRQQFGGKFNDDYYKKMEQAGYDALTPGVDTQYHDAMRQLQAALARAGLGGPADPNATKGPTGKAGSTAVRLQSQRVEDQRAAAGRALVDSVRGAVTGRKQDVANAEQMAMSQLMASADPFAAQTQAANLAAANSAEPRWSPLGQVFTDVTAGMATQADLIRNNQNRYNYGVGWLGGTNRYTKNVNG